jgi:hypothetical protein
LRGTTGEGVEGLWYDAFVHAEDIRAAVGRNREPGPGLRASLSHVADLLGRQAWPAATLAFEPYGEFAIGSPGDGDRRFDGDPLEFVLVATRRLDRSVLGLDETVNIYR